MPYIITTYPDYTGMPSHTFADQRGSESSRTVATLEDARDTAASEVESSPAWIGTEYGFNDCARLMSEAESLPEFGGTIGPLPDGYVIDVRPATIAVFVVRLGCL